MALSADISQRLKKYIQDPVVTVVVLGVNSQRIFTVGEVNKVGPVMLTPGMTPLQAIVSAGGLTQFANSKHIYILRTVDGKQEKIPFNYKAALKGENKECRFFPGTQSSFHEERYENSNSAISVAPDVGFDLSTVKPFQRAPSRP